MQKLQLSISEPCHENWQQMTPTDQGRFCNACAKEVIDFSTMTDLQVLNYFTNLTHEKVCGRALPEQLDRAISRPVEPKKKLFWYWNYMVMFFMFFTKGSNAMAQSCAKPATELNTVKNRDVRGDKVVKGKVASDVRQNMVSGKITDKDGKPVSFATIQVKAIKKAVAADVNGEFKISAAPNSVLVISAVGFMARDVAVANQTEMKIILGNSDLTFLGGAVVVGYQVNDEFYSTPVSQKMVAVLSIKDLENSSALNATIIITKKGVDKSDIIFTDTKGSYKLKGIKNHESFDIKVEADGYEPNEFTIDGSDFKDRKKEWEVLLKRQKSAFGTRIGTSAQNLKEDFQVHVIGQTFVAPLNTDSLHVIDGTIATKTKVDNLNPDDIADIIRLEKSGASAIFGSEGSNGTIVITTRQSKMESLDTVVVSSDFGIRRTAGGISFTNTYTASYLDDTIATVKTLLTDSIKVYPNPVQRNTAFSVSLKLKQAGNYSMEVTDVLGRILLNKKFNTVAKVHTEEIVGDSRWTGGVYYIRIFDAKNKLINKSSFIAQ